MNDNITISTFQLFQLFPDSESARLYLEARLWPNGVKCPICSGGERIGKRPIGYRCHTCNEDFSVRTGTVMERSHIGLREWIAAMVLVAQNPEIPTESFAREIGTTQKTAWLVRKRLHAAFGDSLLENIASDDNFRVVGKFPAYRVGRDGTVWTR